MIRSHKSLLAFASVFRRTMALMVSHNRAKLSGIVLLTLVLGITSGFTVVLLIPLLSLLGGTAGTAAGPVVEFFRAVPEETGITLSVELILFTWVVILAANAFMQYRLSMLDTSFQQTLIYELRRKIFRKILMAEWHTVGSESRSGIMQLLTREIPNMAVWYYYLLRLISSLVTGAVLIAWAALVSPFFTAVIVLSGTFLFFMLRSFVKRSFGLGSGFLESYNRLYKYIDDFWQTLKIAKVNNSEEFHFGRFEEANSSLLNMEYRMQKNFAVPRLLYRIAGLVLLSLFILLGYRSGKTELAAFFTLIILFSRIYPLFVSVSEDLNMLSSNAASAKLVLDSDARFAEPARSEEESSTVITGGDIELDRVSFSYPDGEKILDNFSAVIRKGSITGITGYSGRGKTTLADIIAGLQKPDSGAVRINGSTVVSGSGRQGRIWLGYLPQDPFFVEGTVRDNLIWDLRGETSDSEIYEVLGKVNARHLTDRLRGGLDEYIVSFQNSFSGGECQRLALARVLLRKPQILILDEATSSLDQENEMQIMETISALKGDMTIIFITHRSSLLKWFDSTVEL